MAVSAEPLPRLAPGMCSLLHLGDFLFPSHQLTDRGFSPPFDRGEMEWPPQIIKRAELALPPSGALSPGTCRPGLADERAAGGEVRAIATHAGSNRIPLWLSGDLGVLEAGGRGLVAP